MAVKGDKGKNTINFTYVPPGIKDGILISTLALIFFFIKNMLNNFFLYFNGTFLLN